MVGKIGLSKPWSVDSVACGKNAEGGWLFALGHHSWGTSISSLEFPSDPENFWDSVPLDWTK